MTIRSVLSTAAVLLAAATAQNVRPACDPLAKTGCPSDTALGTTYTQNFTNTIGSSKIWHTSAGSVDWKSDGGEYTIHGQGDSVTDQTKFYIFFGRVSVVMRAAAGQGIVSSMVLLSDTLDEIDWEFLGGEENIGMSNFYGKGTDQFIFPPPLYPH